MDSKDSKGVDMKTLIFGAATLSLALAAASIGWSQNPSPQPTASANGGCSNCAGAVDIGAPAKQGLLGRLGIHCHPLPYHPAEPHHHGHGFGNGYGAGSNGLGNGPGAGNGNGFGNGNGLFGQYDHSPFPTQQAGTVVFPQHPFARSPRDYFMAD
jgi:hypothetical protein